MSTRAPAPPSTGLRVRALRFGHHLSAHLPGALVLLPGGASMNLIKGLLLRALYGDAVDFDALEYGGIHLLLLPEGDAVISTDLLCANDRLVVFASPTPFVGKLSDPANVCALLMDEAVGPPLLQCAYRDTVVSERSALIAQLQGSALALESRVQGGAAAFFAAGGGVFQPPPPPVSRLKLNHTANAKLRRVVHKLVVISRFNKKASEAQHDASSQHLSVRSTASTETLSAVEGGGGDRRASFVAASAPSPSARGGASSSGAASSRTTRGGRLKRHTALVKTMEQYVRDANDLYNYTQQRRLSEEDEALPWYIVRPDVPWRLAWDVVALLLVFYFALTVPVSIGFELPVSYGEMVFDYASDCLFILDVVLNFFTTFKEDGVWVNDPEVIAAKYMSFWFPLDFVSSFPIGWFTDNLTTAGSVSGSASSASGFNKILRLVRLFKLFRLLRLAKLFPKVMGYVETAVKMDPALMRFAKALALLLAMWHFMACSYWFVVRSEYGGTTQCPPPNAGITCFVNQCLCSVETTRDDSLVTVLNNTDAVWYDTNWPDVWVPHASYAWRPFVHQYAFAYFFGVEATTSVGNNISPRSMTEHVFSMIIIVVGLVMYSVIIGSVADALSNSDSDKALQNAAKDRMLAYLRSRKVPTFFQKIILDYYAHRWSLPGASTAGHDTEQDLLGDLPPALRSRLSMILNRDLIERFPVLEFMPVNVYLRMVAHLEAQTYLPGEYVVHQGDPGDHLFLIKRGKVDGVLPNGVSVFATYKPGDFFGEHSLLFLTKRDASFRAVDFVDVLVLARPEFTELYISAPDFIREVQRVDASREKERLKFELAFVQAKASAASRARSTVLPLPTSGNGVLGGTEALKRGSVRVAVRAAAVPMGGGVATVAAASTASAASGAGVGVIDTSGEELRLLPCPKPLTQSLLLELPSLSTHRRQGGGGTGRSTSARGAPPSPTASFLFSDRSDAVGGASSWVPLSARGGAATAVTAGSGRASSITWSRPPTPPDDDAVLLLPGSIDDLLAEVVGGAHHGGDNEIV